MEVRNITRNAALASDVRVARSFVEKTEGLLKEKEPTALFLKTRWGIHTVGMHFPIDCVVCDKHFVVKALRERMGPGRFFFWSPRYENVLELPAGTVARTGTQVGDVLWFS